MASRFTRNQIRRHNGAAGQAHFILGSANSIAALPTVTKEAAHTATEIAVLAQILLGQLRERNEKHEELLNG